MAYGFYLIFSRNWSNWKNRGGKQKKPLKSNNLFPLVSYIISYNMLAVYEYALIEEETHTIRYISLADIESVDNVMFQHEFEPKKILKDSDV